MLHAACGDMLLAAKVACGLKALARSQLGLYLEGIAGADLIAKVATPSIIQTAVIWLGGSIFIGTVFYSFHHRQQG